MLSLRDLQFLRDCGVRIKAEDFAKTLFFENMHRDFSPYSKCRAKTSTAQGSLGGVNSRIVQEVMFPDPFVEIEKNPRNYLKWFSELAGIGADGRKSASCDET